MITPNGRRLGWRKDALDPRDHRLAAMPAPSSAPNYIDLRKSGFEPPVYNQGSLGSCTGNAIAGAIQYALAAQKSPAAAKVPSRLFIYYGEREMEGTIASDAGAEIRDGIKFTASVGVCSEDEWPYDPALFARKPPPAAYARAAACRVLRYARVPQTVDGIRSSLYAGFPVVFGFQCYESLDSDEVNQTGRLPMPRPDEAPLGGHAVLLVGCDIDERTVLVRNSWGSDWSRSIRGHFLMPLEYLLNRELASDFWQISQVS